MIDLILFVLCVVCMVVCVRTLKKRKKETGKYVNFPEKKERPPFKKKERPPFKETYRQAVEEQKLIRHGKLCPRCKGNNISLNLMNTGAVTTEYRKSAAKRGFEKVGRGTANVFTLGAYGLFSKKPTDKVSTSNTTISTVALCHDCGKYWTVSKY